MEEVACVEVRDYFKELVFASSTTWVLVARLGEKHFSRLGQLLSLHLTFETRLSLNLELIDWLDR